MLAAAVVEPTPHHILAGQVERVAAEPVVQAQVRWAPLERQILEAVVEVADTQAALAAQAALAL
jgi:hypothetical protein